MNNINYFQVIAFFYSGIYNQIKQNRTFEQSLHSEHEDMWLYPENENLLNNLIVNIHYLNVIYAMRKNFTIKQIELHKSHLKLVHENINIQALLSEDEYEHFTETLNQLNYEIENWERENTIA